MFLNLKEKNFEAIVHVTGIIISENKNMLLHYNGSLVKEKKNFFRQP